jgi:hypothetical protein
VAEEQKQSTKPVVVNLSEIDNQKNISTPIESKESLISIDSHLVNYVNNTVRIEPLIR